MAFRWRSCALAPVWFAIGILLSWLLIRFWPWLAALRATFLHWLLAPFE